MCTQRKNDWLLVDEEAKAHMYWTYTVKSNCNCWMIETLSSEAANWAFKWAFRFNFWRFLSGFFFWIGETQDQTKIWI